jgi:hypothetical protein
MKKLFIMLVGLGLVSAAYGAGVGLATVSNYCGKRITVLSTSPNGGRRMVHTIYPNRTQPYRVVEQKIYDFALKSSPKSSSCRITVVKGNMHRMKFSMKGNACVCSE